MVFAAELRLLMLWGQIQPQNSVLTAPTPVHPTLTRITPFVSTIFTIVRSLRCSSRLTQVVTKTTRIIKWHPSLWITIWSQARQLQIVCRFSHFAWSIRSACTRRTSLAALVRFTTSLKLNSQTIPFASLTMTKRSTRGTATSAWLNPTCTTSSTSRRPFKNLKTCRCTTLSTRLETMMRLRRLTSWRCGEDLQFHGS